MAIATDTSSGSDFKLIIGLTALALSLRLALINHPGVVVLGEGAVWRSIKNYVHGSFFVSDRPPLASLLFGALFRLVGGAGDFESVPTGGQAYPTGLPFIPLRLLSGVLGAAIVPIAYATLRASGLSPFIATMTAGCLALDNALVTQSRVISNDSFSTLLAAISYFAWTKYYVQGKKTKWHLVLGASLGASLSCNWLLGLASILFALLYSAASLWTDFCTQVPMTMILKRALKSVLALVLLPLALYSAIFAVHFSLITSKADESLLINFSPEFQQYFNPLPSTFGTVVYGSIVTLRHRASPSLHLHSHALAWPSGSKQQQVTGYAFADRNNDWIIREALGHAKQDGNVVRSGDLVRLQHVTTGRFLHSHHEEPPESNKEHHREVSCYGESAFSDFNDNWRIELVDKHGNVLPRTPLTPITPITAINSTFRLFHPNANCSLSSFAKKLPDYAAGQYEVTCGTETLRYHSVWMIETNQHDSSRGTGNLVQYKAAGFFQRLLEVHVKMLGMIKPKPGDVQQTPWHFAPVPLWSSGPRSGSSLKSTVKNRQPSLKTFILPNPVLWILGFCSISIFFLGCFISKARSLEGSTRRSQFFHLDSSAGHAVTFWALHTLSFLLLPNHSLVDYLPALYASIMLSAQLLKNHSLVAVSVWCGVLASFGAFLPLSYGLAVAPEFCEKLQLFAHWKLGCSL